MKRGIAYCGLFVLTLPLAACQQNLNWGAPRNKPVPPSQSIESLIPQQTPATAPARPLPEPRTPAMLAVHEAPVQSNDPYGVAPKSPRVHLVQPGETLFGLARQYYADQRQWRKIYQANRNRLDDPKNVRVGMKLIIP